MKKKLLYSFLLCLLLITGTEIFAQQDSCNNKLFRAQMLYEQGLLEDIPAILEPCFTENVSRDFELQAYKLIILSYIFDDNQIKADESMLSFLKAFPEYKVTPDDPVEFVFLFDTYESIPLYSIGISAGTNFTHQFISERFSTGDLNSPDITYKWFEPGYEAGLRFSRNFSNDYEVNIEVNYSTGKFGYLQKMENVYESEVINTLSRIEIPLTVTYDFKEFSEGSKIRPFLRFGFAVSSLVSGKADFSMKYLNGENSFSKNGVDISSNLNSMNFWLVGGGGLKYTLPSGHFFLDLRYNFGLMEEKGDGNGFDNNEQIYQYMHLDDNYRQGTISVQLGYVMSFYQFRKKR